MPVRSFCRAPGAAAALLGLLLAFDATATAAPGREPLADAAALRAFADAQQRRAPAPRLPRLGFLARPQLREAALSPDGRQVAALVDDGRSRSLRVATRAQPQGRVWLARSSAQSLAWSRDGRWLFLAEATRVVALPADGRGGATAVAELGERLHRRFVGADPWLPAAALLLEAPPSNAAPPHRFRLWRAHPGGRLERLHEGRLPIVDVAFAPDGRPSHLLLAARDRHVLLRHEGPARWKALAVCADMHRCRFVGTRDQGRTLLMLSDLDDDLLGLVRVEADGSRRTLHRDPRGAGDVASLALDGDGQPRMAAYDAPAAQLLGLDAADRARAAAWQARFAGRSLSLQPGREAWLLRERGGDLHGERLHLMDPGAPGAAGVEPFADLGFQDRGKPRPRLSSDGLAAQRAVRWTASDGLPLHGYLLLPPGIPTARAPLVVLVHGGPFNHVRAEFNAQAQFLANRGVAVFLPNFRSSTGHGRRQVLAAHGDFGGDGPVQRDIVEGTRWLLANGIGDPRRVGIVGASFGGYSTLLGLSFQPELFKVGVAAVPPSDFGFVIREYLGANKPMQPGIPIGDSMRHLGLDPADHALMARLAAASPKAHAARMARPLLLLAGGEDDRVPIRGVTHYAATLQRLGKDVSLFVDADAGHGIADPRTREAYLYLEELLLQRVFGGATPEPPSRELAAHLQRNLRLRGAALRDLP